MEISKLAKHAAYNLWRPTVNRKTTSTEWYKNRNASLLESFHGDMDAFRHLPNAASPQPDSGEIVWIRCTIDTDISHSIVDVRLPNALLASGVCDHASQSSARPLVAVLCCLPFSSRMIPEGN